MEKATWGARWACPLVALLALAGCDDKGGDSGSGGDANLVVVSVVCTKEGGDAECNVVVENDGDEATGSFEVGLFTGPDEPTEGDTPVDSATINDLPAGEVQGSTLTASGCGDCQIWAMADFTDAVAERYEDDNTASTTPVRRRR